MNKRKILLHINKFQHAVLFYLIVLVLACLILMLLFLSYLYADLHNFLYSFPFRIIKDSIIFSFPAIAVLLVLISFHIYRLTNRIFGPYERILKELDILEETSQKEELFVRKDDEMFSELLERINALIRRLP